MRFIQRLGSELFWGTWNGVQMGYRWGTDGVHMGYRWGTPNFLGYTKFGFGVHQIVKGGVHTKNQSVKKKLVYEIPI